MYICLIYLLLMTCTLFVGYELNLLKVKVHTKASYRLNSEVLFYIHRLPYDTTMFMDSSYYTQRINNDATQIISYILEALSGIIINVVSIILPSVVIFNIFPPILPGIFLAIMLYVFAYTAMRSVLYKTGMAFKEGQSVFFKKLDLSVRFSENVILHSVNMHFEKGKIYGVAGNNGTGKTTLINILAGLYRNCYSGNYRHFQEGRGHQ